MKKPLTVVESDKSAALSLTKSPDQEGEENSYQRETGESNSPGAEKNELLQKKGSVRVVNVPVAGMIQVSIKRRKGRRSRLVLDRSSP